MSKVVLSSGPGRKTLVPGPGLKLFFDRGWVGTGSGLRFLAETETGPEPKFFLTKITTGTETKMFLAEPQQQFFTRNDNLYGHVRLLLSVILSQLMYYKYSSKTLQKSLSRDSQSGSGTEIGIKIFLFTGTRMGTTLNFLTGIETGPKKVGRSCLDSKRSLKGFYQSDNIKVPKQKKTLERERDQSAFCNIQDR